MTIASAPTAHLAQPRQPVGLYERTTKLERDSHLFRLTLVLDDLSRRYPTLSRTTIRAQAVDVLSHSLPERLTPSMVARVLEARLSALL